MKTLTRNEAQIYLGVNPGKLREIFRNAHIEPCGTETTKGRSAPRWVYKYGDIVKAKKRWKGKQNAAKRA